MNAIRIALTLFIAAVVVILATGWGWTSTHQPPAQAVASHVMLGLAIVASVIGVVAIWRVQARPRSAHRP
ncbi:MAG TPA: hypothetical protein VG871_19330 [Vicinamibacterales bacterium]|nr:hypothetical protein [Vicinamibacterales bacterium]